MNGQDHYREAERLIEAAEAHDGNPGWSRADTIALAQVHADLARAAFGAVAAGLVTISNPAPGSDEAGRPQPPVTDTSWLKME